MGECVIGSPLNKQGYVYVSGRGHGRLGHRVVWEEAHGPIPKGFHIHHVCGNRGCIRLDHLEMLHKTEHRQHHRKCNRPDHERRMHPDGFSYCRTCANERQSERLHSDPEYAEKRRAYYRQRRREANERNS